MCEVDAVGKTSLTDQPDGPGFSPRTWSSVELLATFFRHTVRGKGRPVSRWSNHSTFYQGSFKALLHCAIFSATCLAMPLREKLLENYTV